MGVTLMDNGLSIKQFCALIFFMSLTSFSPPLQETTVGYIFSHGLADTHKQAYHYLKSSKDQLKPYSINGSFITFDYPDATDHGARVLTKKASLGQDNEIKRFAHTYFNNFSFDHRAVVLGVSRGASVLVNFMGLYNPYTIHAAVLESPFDSVENIVLGMINRARLIWIPRAREIGLALTRFIFTKYRAEGIRPIDVVDTIYTDLPLLFVCCAQDKLVPVWSTLNLYKKLKESGHTQVHVLILPEGSHAHLINDPVHGVSFQNVVHAFYKHYHLPHDPLLAIAGADLFKRCQPDSKDLAYYYPDYLTS